MQLKQHQSNTQKKHNMSDATDATNTTDALSTNILPQTTSSDQFREHIGLILEIISEFVQKYEQLAPEHKGICNNISVIIATVMCAREIIFRTVIGVLADKLVMHKDKIEEKNPEFWLLIDFFGIDMQGFWLLPDLTDDIKECIWNYLLLFVRAIERARMVDADPTVMQLDWVTQTLIQYSESINVPSILALVNAETDKLHQQGIERQIQAQETE